MLAGSEFQIIGAATRKPREPNAKLYSGTVNKLQPDDRKVLDGTYGEIKLQR